MQMAVRGVSGSAVALAAAGVILTYSGVKGKKISTTARDLIAGKNPATDTTVDLPTVNNATDAGGDLPAGNRFSGGAGTLTPAQIYSVAVQAGFNPVSAIIATAVALAESGGNPRAHNAVPPDDSYGLMQINMIGNLGPARRAQFGLSSNDELFDPLTNMRAAHIISNGGTNFTPWTTFTSGAYLHYLPTARAAANG